MEWTRQGRRAAGEGGVMRMGQVALFFFCTVICIRSKHTSPFVGMPATRKDLTPKLN
jgi:hypothetical protein